MSEKWVTKSQFQVQGQKQQTPFKKPTERANIFSNHKDQEMKIEQPEETFEFYNDKEE